MPAHPSRPRVRHAALPAVLLLSLVTAVAAPSALAGEVTVTDLGDQPLDQPGQLRTLIRAAQNGDVIRVGEGTVSLVLAGQDEEFAASGDLDVTKNLTIVGAGAGLTIIDAAGKDRVFDVRPNVTLTLIGLTVQGGRDPGALSNFGLGIRVGGSLVLRDVVVRDNQINGSATGGGIYVGPGAFAELNGVTLSENVASLGGGGIAVDGALLYATNVTISGNTVEQSGSGLLVVNGGRATLAGVTITGNQGVGGGPSSGLAVSLGGTVLARQVVIGGSTGPVGSNDCSGNVTGTGPNLIEVNGCTFSGVAPLTGAPGLGPLADNGGPTPTHLPGEGSPLVDAGGVSCLTHWDHVSFVDQRGVRRPQGEGCDLGALEVVGPPPAPTSDFDGDGRADVVVAAGRGDEPLVKILSGATGLALAEFRAYDAPYRGGVNVAVCDLTGDGVPEVITAPASGPALIRAFDGASPGTPLAGTRGGFLAFPPGARPLGATVACADVSGDGVPDIIVGPGPGGDGLVRSFSGVDGSPLGTAAPFPGNRSGIAVAP
jgi:hypothetical protein